MKKEEKQQVMLPDNTLTSKNNSLVTMEGNTLLDLPQEVKGSLFQTKEKDNA
jgi:hypothetical protein